MRREFVIHIHSGHGPTHFDFMIDAGDALTTWRLAERPDRMAPGDVIRATPLPDHRRAYLTYEGPVSRGRGRVDRLDAGQCEILLRRGDLWRIRLSGERIGGLHELAADAEGAWTLRRLPDEHD